VYKPKAAVEQVYSEKLLLLSYADEQDICTSDKRILLKSCVVVDYASSKKMMDIKME